MLVIEESLMAHMQKMLMAIYDKELDASSKHKYENKLIAAVSTYHKTMLNLPAGSVSFLPLKTYTPILVVEDSLVERQLHAKMLSELGFTKVLQAKEGQEALAIMKQQHSNDRPVGLVLCDWNMPNMSGIELLKIVRKSREFYLTPVFFVTGNSGKAHIVASIKSGVTGYLVKPITIESIKAKLKHYLPDTAA